jgi:hypothetical protein
MDASLVFSLACRVSPLSAQDAGGSTTPHRPVGIRSLCPMYDGDPMPRTARGRSRIVCGIHTHPGQSPLSQTLVATSMYFAPMLNAGSLFPLEALLQDLRRDPDLLERKAGIYAKPGVVTLSPGLPLREVSLMPDGESV